MTNPVSADVRETKSAKERNTKILSTGLAIATGIGIVGVIGFRTAEEASAKDSSAQDGAINPSGDVAATLDGLTTQQLEEYAQALQQEAARLSQYREQLNQIANQLATQSGGAVTLSSKPAQTLEAKVAPVPPTQKQAPQTYSQGSG